MKHMMSRLFLVLSFFVSSVLFFSIVASADIFIEPWVGYEGGTFKFDGASTAMSSSTTPPTSGTITGSNFGGRLGFKFLGFMVGGEYSYAGLSEKPSSGSSLSQKSTDGGVFVGFNFPMLLRVYATYFVSSSATVDTYVGDFSGSGYRAGVGFTGLPFVVINVEAIGRDYNKYSGNAISGGDLKNTSVCVNISLPLP